MRTRITLVVALNACPSVATTEFTYRVSQGMIVRKHFAVTKQPSVLYKTGFYGNLDLVRMCVRKLVPALGRVTPWFVSQWGSIPGEVQPVEEVVVGPLGEEHHGGGMGLELQGVDVVAIKMEVAEEFVHADAKSHVAVFVVLISRFRRAEPKHLHD